MLGTYNTIAFCMTHQTYRHQLSTHLVLTKQMVVCMTQAYRHQMSTYFVLTKQMPSVWLIRYTGTDCKMYLILTQMYEMFICLRSVSVMRPLWSKAEKKEHLMWRLCMSIYDKPVTVATPLAKFSWNHIYEVFAQSCDVGVIFMKIVSGTVLLYLKA
jgi:hypothetical protein